MINTNKTIGKPWIIVAKKNSKICLKKKTQILRWNLYGKIWATLFLWIGCIEKQIWK